MYLCANSLIFVTSHFVSVDCFFYSLWTIFSPSDAEAKNFSPHRNLGNHRAQLISPPSEEAVFGTTCCQCLKTLFHISCLVFSVVSGRRLNLVPVIPSGPKARVSLQLIL